MIIIKSNSEIEKIKESCKIVAEVLTKLYDKIKPGVTTKTLNNLAEEIIVGRGAIPGFKGYKGYPYTICSSINEEIIHGFPSSRKLLDGDIISIDVGVVKDGWYGDAAFTKGVGDISAAAEILINTTRNCLYNGIEEAKTFNRVGNISSVIQHTAEEKGFNVVKEFVGHGVGRNLHEDPQIPNYGNPWQGYLLKPGMVIAIEPMVLIGSPDIKTLTDGWTVVSESGNISAHFEHTIAITDNGTVVLTELG